MSKQTNTKSKLLDAAEAHVRSVGVDGFSYGDLSAHIGIRKASIHYHFPTKSDLLGAIMKRYRVQVSADLKAMRETHDSARACLLAFVDYYRAAAQEGAVVCLCVAYANSADRLPSAIQSDIGEFRKSVKVWLETVVNRLEADNPWSGTAPSAIAAAILAQVEGAQIAARLQGSLAAFDTATALLRATLQDQAARAP